MLKKKRSSHPAPTKGNNIFTVQSIDTVTNACRDTVRAVIGNNQLGFQNQQLTRRRWRCMLSGPGAAGAYAREPYLAHVLLETPGKSYWLAVVIYFQFETRESKYRLESLSLVVFEGDRSDPAKTPLLRAEWDCSDLSENPSHAQPHWHVYLSALATDAESLDFDTMNDVTEFAFEDRDQEQDIEVTSPWKPDKFHFAMSSGWQVDADCPLQESFDDLNQLKSWLQGCITYTRQQLSILSS
jgi:hypothetical protein